MVCALQQRAIFKGLSEGGRYLKFTANIVAALQRGGDPGCYPIVFNPRDKKKTLIIGMFALRPANHSWDSPILAADNRMDSRLYCVEDWAYNYLGLDGGWLIADRSPLDAFRVALQYGLSDAVIVGTNTVSREGVDTASKKGYLWQSDFIVESTGLKAACPDAVQLIAEQRVQLQQQGYLSSRRYPAVIVFSLSGDCQGTTDFLSARAFTAYHPDGQLVECYILTGERGASSIRRRVISSFPHLADRIEDMLVVVPGPQMDDQTVAAIDIASVPQLLYDRLGVRIANHDGGLGVLRAFCRAGAVAQVNLTLCRTRSLRDIVSKYEAHTDGADFDSRVQMFFSSTSASQEGGSGGRRAELSGAIPEAWRAVYCLADGEGDVAVVSFDTREAGDF